MEPVFFDCDARQRGISCLFLKNNKYLQPMNEKPVSFDLSSWICILEEALQCHTTHCATMREFTEAFKNLADMTPAAVLLYQDDRWIAANR
jgi:hypothetical protein